MPYLSAEFEPQKDMFDALDQNKGIFDFGFTFVYVGEMPFEFEYYLFIGQHFWRIHRHRENEREFCVNDLMSDQHREFTMKYSLAFSYLSDHMVKHKDELNLTNHVLLGMLALNLTLKIPVLSRVVHHQISNRLQSESESNEVSEWIFDANHDNLDNLIGADFYVFTIPGFQPSVAFQPQSFLDDEVTDGPNFVFIEQNKTDSGYDRRIQIHSIIDEVLIRNRTEQYGQYIPPFILDIDRQLYINVILPTRLGPGGVDEGIPAVILIIPHEGVIKYCVTEEKRLHQNVSAFIN